MTLLEAISYVARADRIVDLRNTLAALTRGEDRPTSLQNNYGANGGLLERAEYVRFLTVDRTPPPPGKKRGTVKVYITDLGRKALEALPE